MATGNFICNGSYPCWSCWRRVNLVAHCQQYYSTCEHRGIYNCSPLHHILPRVTSQRTQRLLLSRKKWVMIRVQICHCNKPILCNRCVTVCSFKFVRHSYLLRPVTTALLLFTKDLFWGLFNRLGTERNIQWLTQITLKWVRTLIIWWPGMFQCSQPFHVMSNSWMTTDA